MISMIPGGEWFAMFSEEGVLKAHRIVCWVAHIDGDGFVTVQGYINIPILCSVEESSNFIEYRYQYKEEPVMRKVTSFE